MIRLAARSWRGCLPSGGDTAIEREVSTTTATWFGTRAICPSSRLGCSATIRQAATPRKRSANRPSARPRRCSQISDTADSATAKPAPVQIRISVS